MMRPFSCVIVSGAKNPDARPFTAFRVTTGGVSLMTSELEKTAAPLTQGIVRHPGAYPAPSLKQGLRVLQ